MRISPHDRDILRRLAEKQAAIAALPVHKHTIEGWKHLNSLQKGKPMVWYSSLPWHELDVDGELALQTSGDFSRGVEQQLRRTIYQWEHMRGDMVVEPVFYSPLIINDSGFEISEDVDIARTDEKSNIVSRHFHIQISGERDLEKIKTPVVTHDAQASEENYQALLGAFGDILPVQKQGQPGFWFAPWDLLIRWWGVQQMMIDLVDRPELAHHAMDRLVDAFIARLDQYERLGLLAYNNGNVATGSGAPGFTDELPQSGSDKAHPRARDLWGCAAAQIFTEVSPRMHEEFALSHERRWLERWGLTYYGCCEALHAKIDILKSIPNLRKISMSPWINVDQAVKNVGDRYVFSYKPNPAILAGDVWRPDEARRDLTQVLEKARGCHVEIIMKTLSTVRYQPQRLWEWVDIATDVTAGFA